MPGPGGSVGDAAVAGDVAVLAADADEDQVGVADRAELTRGRRVDAGETAGVEAVDGPVAEGDLGGSGVDEVELLLRVVEVVGGLGAGGEDDGVDTEGRDAENGADLAKAVAGALSPSSEATV